MKKVKKESLKTLKIDLNDVYFAHSRRDINSGDSTFKGPCSADDNVSHCRCMLDFRYNAESTTSAWFHTSWRFDLEIISTAILLPSADSRRVVRDVKHQNKQTKVCLKLIVP